MFITVVILLVIHKWVNFTAHFRNHLSNTETEDALTPLFHHVKFNVYFFGFLLGFCWYERLLIEYRIIRRLQVCLNT